MLPTAGYDLEATEHFQQRRLALSEVKWYRARNDAAKVLQISECDYCLSNNLFSI